jgi:hypothetical protein
MATTLGVDENTRLGVMVGMVGGQSAEWAKPSLRGQGEGWIYNHCGSLRLS